MSLRSVPFTLNCSRVAPQGGLKTFALQMMQAILGLGYPCKAVVPYGFQVPPGVEALFTPATLAGASNISALRPIKWLAYSRFQFPVPASERVLCTTHHVLPGRRNQIVTVHDLRPYFYPDTSVQSYYFRTMLPRALRRCDGILTVSETSRQLIAEIYKIGLDRIAVVPNVIQQPAAVPSSPDGQEPYLLAVGASWPHKNIEPLLAAHKYWSPRFSLKIVAGKGQYQQKLQTVAETLGISSRVTFLSDVSADALDTLYAQCAALVAPSRMEGFGLPPLEAMARQRPVLVADIPVFRELYGEHACYVNTEEPAAWAEAFTSLGQRSPRQLAAAQSHATAYSADRMSGALQQALKKFWNV